MEGCEKLGGIVKQILIPRFPCERGELKHLSNRRKIKKNSISLVAASEEESSLNQRFYCWGRGALHCEVTKSNVSRTGLKARP